jgi:hypothetical protein
MTETFYDFEKPTNSDKESFATPMPMPDSELKKLDCNQHEFNQPESSGISFLKRNASFILNNLHVPKVMRRKPNLESTRKICSCESKIISPRSQIESTISTLTLPNTPSNPDGYESMEKAQQEQQHQQQQRQQSHAHMQKSMNATIPYEVLTRLNCIRMRLSVAKSNSSRITRGSCASHLHVSFYYRKKD